MAKLRAMAEEKLNATGQVLGKQQQNWQQAVNREAQLKEYEREYQQSLRHNMQTSGMRVADLLNHQSFIASLSRVVHQHGQHVSHCQQAVNQARDNWLADRQRLNAFDALITRQQQALLRVERRQQQKQMDEFAQRTRAEERADEY